MARSPTLTFDRGTLILHPPPRGKCWLDYATWDDRVERFRVPALHYRALLESLRQEGVECIDQAGQFERLELIPRLQMEPYPHQREALQTWQQAGRRGVVVLPTAAGKTYLAQLVLQTVQRRSLVVVPTLDLMHQWYAHLEAAFPDVEVGLLGGGSRDLGRALLVATYDSAAIHAEALGNQYMLLVFDECHHLPSNFNRVIAEYAIAPYRLGLTATPERSDGRHADLQQLIGPEVYHKTAADLSGHSLAAYEIVQIKVNLAQRERDRYDSLIQERNAFLQQANIRLGSLAGWQRFVRESAISVGGRRAMLAHHQAKAIALGTDAKLRVLADLLAQHFPASTLVFTNDNATVYCISQQFLIPALTHQTPVKERHQILQKFRAGIYKTVVASHVLNEGVDVPEASIAILLSGTGSNREYIQRLGRILRRGQGQKHAILYEVISAGTTEEGISQRRRQPRQPGPKQLELSPGQSLYEIKPGQTPRAAEVQEDW